MWYRQDGLKQVQKVEQKPSLVRNIVLCKPSTSNATLNVYLIHYSLLFTFVLVAYFAEDLPQHPPSSPHSPTLSLNH